MAFGLGTGGICRAALGQQKNVRLLMLAHLLTSSCLDSQILYQLEAAIQHMRGLAMLLSRHIPALLLNTSTFRVPHWGGAPLPTTALIFLPIKTAPSTQHISVPLTTRFMAGRTEVALIATQQPRS